MRRISIAALLVLVIAGVLASIGLQGPASPGHARMLAFARPSGHGAVPGMTSAPTAPPMAPPAASLVQRYVTPSGQSLPVPIEYTARLTEAARMTLPPFPIVGWIGTPLPRDSSGNALGVGFFLAAAGGAPLVMAMSGGEPPAIPTGDPPTDPPVNPPTNPPVDPPTNPPGDPGTNPPGDPGTNPPTDPPTNPPTNPPTDPPTNPPTDPPVNPPVTPPENPPISTPEPVTMTLLGSALIAVAAAKRRSRRSNRRD